MIAVEGVKGETGLGGGAIAGITVGVVGATVGVIGAVVYGVFLHSSNAQSAFGRHALYRV